MESSDPSLDLLLLESGSDFARYDQRNTTATRKTILPMLKHILSTAEPTNVFSHHGEKGNLASAASTVYAPRLHITPQSSQLFTNLLWFSLPLPKQDGNPDDGSSASSSGIDTPTNSCVDDEEIRSSPLPKLSDFQSAGNALAGIEPRKYLAFRRRSDGLHNEEGDPLTPENSFAESHFDKAYKKFVLDQMDSDAIEKKLRQENFFSEAND